MLQKQTVNGSLLGLLNHCMNLEELKDFRLVGGTALALRYGHRNSIDIDLFGSSILNPDLITQLLLQYSNDFNLLKGQKNIYTAFVNQVKIDFVYYPFPWIEEVEIEENIRFAGIKDIAAMKLNAIVGRGTKKDFIDLDLLLNYYSLPELIDFYKTKYNQASEYMVCKSLMYFADADNQAEPAQMANFNWQKVKDRIKKEVEKYLT